MKQTLIALTFLMACQTMLLGQETILTDRPNVIDAVGLISPGIFQLEVGYSYQNYDGGEFTSSTLPNVGVKYGLVNWLELRLFTNYQRTRQGQAGGDVINTGVTPVTLSPKIKIGEQKGWLPKLSLATSFTFPDIGERAFQNDKLNYGFRLLMESDKLFPMSASFGTDWDDSGENTWAYALSTGTSFSDKMGFFLEVYGNFANDIDDQHGVDGGVTYLINNDLQADVLVGLPLNEYAPDIWLGFGLAWRTHTKH